MLGTARGDPACWSSTSGEPPPYDVHHDPLHSDARLDLLRTEARTRWVSAGGDPAAIELAVEGTEIELGAAAPAPPETP